MKEPLRLHLRPQQTIERAVQVEGFGFWSGKDVRIEFRPAPVHAGIVFVRYDQPEPKRIPAALDYRIEMPRRTTLASGGVAVEMVEHILAALAGMQVDNCEVWTNGAEMPGCDGSSRPFVAALDSAGIVKQNAVRTQLVVRETLRVGNDDAWVEAQPATKPGLTVKYRLDYGPDNAIGRQTIELPISPSSFRRELAPARTFLMHEEAEWLRQRNLGQRVTSRDVLVFGDAGPIDNELRFEDECVRHKALDLVGDLALAGCDIVGYIVAHRSGHRLNAELARGLVKEGELLRERRKSA